MANVMLILIYFLVCFASSTLLYLLVTYLKAKPLDLQGFKDYVEIDLSYSIGFCIIYYSALVGIREILGPFRHTFGIDVALFVFLLSYNNIMTFTVSNQIVQFMGLFYADQVHRWKENIALVVHRLSAFGFGLVFSIYLCYNKAGVCWNGPVMLYFVLDEKEEPYKPPLGNLLTLIIFMAAILFCQIAVEVKKYVLNRDDDRTDNQAANAVVQLEAALSKLKTASLPRPSTPAWPNPFEASRTQSVFSISSFQDSKIVGPKISKSRHAKQEAIKKGRFYTACFLSSTFIFFCTVSLNSIDFIRPHGPTLVMFFFVGIAGPLAVILPNKKIKTFVTRVIKRDC